MPQKILKPVTLESLSENVESLSIAVSKLATKDELKIAVSNLATKDDMNESIDELARMVAVGFKGNDQKFSELSSELSDFKIETAKNFDKVNYRIDKIDRKFDKVKVPLLQLAHEIQ